MRDNVRFEIIKYKLDKFKNKKREIVKHNGKDPTTWPPTHIIE